MFQDGFGTRRYVFDADSGEPTEVLEFAPALARAAGFGAAVGERVARLAAVRHASYARVRRLDRPAPEALHLVSDLVSGWRLSHVLAHLAGGRAALDISAILLLLRQLLPAAGLFARHRRDAVIGTLAPERVLLTPAGRLVIAEYVLAPGLEQLRSPRERLWRDLRVAVPPSVEPGSFEPRADVTGVGVVALSLLLGRPLAGDEYLVSLGELVESATESHAGIRRRLSADLRTWLSRALHFAPATAFATMQEAQIAFEQVLASEQAYVNTAAHLEQFLAELPRHLPLPAPPGAAADARLSSVPSVPPRREDAVPVFTEKARTPPVAPAPSGSEAPDRAADADVRPAPRAPLRHAVAALVILAVAQSAAIAWLSGRGPAADLLGSGELVVHSRPVAARVAINGEERGVTPLTTGLAPGAHVVEVRVGRSEPRVIPVTIRAGVQSALYVELQSVATVGGLEVRSEPARAQVTIAGRVRGETPLTVTDLPPGEIDVVVKAGAREVRQRVRIEPGITSQLVVPLSR